MDYHCRYSVSVASLGKAQHFNIATSTAPPQTEQSTRVGGVGQSAGVQTDIGDTSSESSGEEFSRKRTTPKMIDMGSPPAVGAFRVWLNDLYEICSNAS